MKNEKNNIFCIISRKDEKCWKKSKMMKKGHILLKKAKTDVKKEKKYFCIFSGKYGKMSKRVKNDEKGSYIAENGQNW